MDELFSCRNCIHNAGQTLNVGSGAGLCLKHASVIEDPINTTCKYLHRKDLPWFVVDEGRSEHAAEFAHFSGLVSLQSHEPIQRKFYSERYTWENNTFDSLTNALARYHRSNKKWIFIEALTGGIDGRRSVAQASLTRRYMDICGTWRSSFRLTIDVVCQLAQKPAFLDNDLLRHESSREDALWDVLFSRLTLVQEYGWHAGLEKLQWVTDYLAEIYLFEWESLKPRLDKAVPEILEIIFSHARENGAYFESHRFGEESVADLGDEADEE